MTDLEAIVLLNSYSSMHLQKLEIYLQRYGSLEAILKEDREIKEKCARFDLAEEMRTIKREGVELVSFMDERYPKALNQISSPPLLLYVQGDPIILKQELSIAMVGSRKATHYGIKIAEEWAREFVSYGVGVVSGLAVGIDAAAHQGALKGKGKTIAVLGSGLARLYPSEHRRLADQISESGAIISEFPMTMEPATFNFPRRNRIISGLSLGVIIVEAARKSGALVTASLALEQGKEVFALPGRVDSLTSVGAHRLLKDGATIALSPRQVLEELALPVLQQETSSENVSSQFEEVERNSILRILSDEAISLDELVKQLQRPVTEIMSELSLLELAGKVEHLSGPRYIKRSLVSNLDSNVKR